MYNSTQIILATLRRKYVSYNLWVVGYRAGYFNPTLAICRAGGEGRSEISLPAPLCCGGWGTRPPSEHMKGSFHVQGQLRKRMGRWGGGVEHKLSCRVKWESGASGRESRTQAGRWEGTLESDCFSWQVFVKCLIWTLKCLFSKLEIHWCTKQIKKSLP